MSDQENDAAGTRAESSESAAKRQRRSDDRDEKRKCSPDEESSDGKGKQKDEETDDDEQEKKEQSPEEKQKARRKKWIISGIIAAVVIIGLIVGIPWYLHARHFETTDDAFIDAHVEQAAPQVAGRVLRVLVDDNQIVRAGQTLVEIDPADYRVAAEQAQAGLAEATAKVAQAQAQEHVAEANVAQGQADVEQAQANLDNALVELKRYEALSPEALSRQRLDDLRTAAKNEAAQLKATQERLAANRAQVALAGSEIQAGQASVQSAQSQLDQAKLNLSYATLRASIAGRVTHRQVQAGDYVKAGQQLMILVPREVWVTANYKETQLTDMRVGQPVTIKVDAYPDREFAGKVESIQAGAGAWFSLLPPENATGNYVKVVQRVPVKITFDDTSSDDYARLGPGMSVDPKVRVR